MLIWKMSSNTRFPLVALIFVQAVWLCWLSFTMWWVKRWWSCWWVLVIMLKPVWWLICWYDQQALWLAGPRRNVIGWPWNIVIGWSASGLHRCKLVIGREAPVKWISVVKTLCGTDLLCMCFCWTLWIKGYNLWYLLLFFFYHCVSVVLFFSLF